MKSVQTLSNCPPKNRPALKVTRNGFTSVSERDNSETTRAKVPLTLACLAPNGQKSVEEERELDINIESLRGLWELLVSVSVQGYVRAHGQLVLLLK